MIVSRSVVKMTKWQLGSLTCVQAWLLVCLVSAAVPCSCIYHPWWGGGLVFISPSLSQQVWLRSSAASNPGGEIAFAWWMFRSVPTKEWEIAALEILGGIHRVLAVHPRNPMLLFIAISFFLSLLCLPSGCLGHLDLCSEAHFKNWNKGFTIFLLVLTSFCKLCCMQNKHLCNTEVSPEL